MKRNVMYVYSEREWSTERVLLHTIKGAGIADAADAARATATRLEAARTPEQIAAGVHFNCASKRTATDMGLI